MLIKRMNVRIKVIRVDKFAALLVLPKRYKRKTYSGGTASTDSISGSENLVADDPTLAQLGASPKKIKKDEFFLR